MQYTLEDIAYIQNVSQKAPSEHVRILAEMIKSDSPYRELFSYGLRFTPQLEKRSEKTNLDGLVGYKPEIVEFFETIAELPSLPKELSDLATDFAIYANGKTIQSDREYYHLNPKRELAKVFRQLGI